MTQAEMEAAYIALTNDVQTRARQIFGLAGTGQNRAAAEKAAELGELVADRREQFCMEKEASAANSDRYDLSALAVAPDTLTNSETAYERD